MPKGFLLLQFMWFEISVKAQFLRFYIVVKLLYVKKKIFGKIQPINTDKDILLCLELFPGYEHYPGFVPLPPVEDSAVSGRLCQNCRDPRCCHDPMHRCTLGQ